MPRVRECVLLLCVVGAVLAQRESAESRLTWGTAERGRLLGRRYAESTIASDISKIVDSMVQKNFVNFLLTRREKKSEHTADSSAELGETQHLFNDLMKQEFTEWVLSKVSKDKVQ